MQKFSLNNPRGTSMKIYVTENRWMLSEFSRMKFEQIWSLKNVDNEKSIKRPSVMTNNDNVILRIIVVYWKSVRNISKISHHRHLFNASCSIVYWSMLNQLVVKKVFSPFYKTQQYEAWIESIMTSDVQHSSKCILYLCLSW